LRTVLLIGLSHDIAWVNYLIEPRDSVEFGCSLLVKAMPSENGFKLAQKRPIPGVLSPMHADLDREHVVDSDSESFALSGFDCRSRCFSIDQEDGSSKAIFCRGMRIGGEAQRVHRGRKWKNIKSQRVVSNTRGWGSSIRKDPLPGDP